MFMQIFLFINFRIHGDQLKREIKADFVNKKLKINQLLEMNFFVLAVF